MKKIKSIPKNRGVVCTATSHLCTWKLIMIVLLTFSSFLTSNVFSQSTSCSTATLLTAVNAASCTPGTSFQINGTGSGPSYSSCATNASSINNWGQFVANSSTASISYDPPNSRDAMIFAYSGTCPGSLTQIGCVDAVGNNSTETLNLTGLTAGATYYVRIVAYNRTSGNMNGTICIASPYSINTGSITGSPFCAGTAVSVPFTSYGTYSSNTYTVQLSNSAGSFASPVNIGTLVSNANSGSISASIPAGTTSGTGYRVRVVSSNPVVTGSNNGTNLTVNALPTITSSATATAKCFSAAAQASSLSYSATTNSPNSYTITWNAAALAAGLVNLGTTALTSSPVNIPIAAGVAAGTYTGTIGVTNANGCISSGNSFNLTIHAIPTVTITPNYCIGGGVVRLTCSAQTSYLWNTGATTQAIDVTLAGNYSVTGTNAGGCSANANIAVAQELVTNGNFSAGNTGFTTLYGYTNAANGLYPEGLYSIGTDANYYHGYFFGNDHTSGSGNFMIVNGSAATQEIWEQVVTVTPNTTYYFSAWATSLNDVAPYAQLRFAVNNVEVGTTAVLPAGANSTAGPFSWYRFFGTWNSGSSTSATINIVDLQTAAGGNDFGLDDISFSTLSPVTMTVAPAGNTPVCAGNPLNLTANVTGGGSPFTYSWTGPGGFTSGTQNPVIASAAASNAGVYALTVTDGNGCTANGSTAAVTVNPRPTITTAASASTRCLSGSAQTSTLSYSATTNSPVTYTIVWNAAALVAGLVNVNSTALPATPVTFPVAAGVAAATYTGTLTVTNANGCVSTGNAFTFIVSAYPVMTSAASTGVCTGGTASIPLTSSVPSTYTWVAAANANVSGESTTNQSTSTLSNILTLSVAGAQVVTYTVTPASNPGGCVGTPQTVLVSVNPLPTITTSATAASRCFSSSAQTSTLSYSATTNTPTNYTITWNAAALAAGLVNVGSTALPATPITFNIAAGVAAGTYTGTVMVTNANSCSNAGNIFTVTINPLPTITTAATAAARCFSSSAQTSTLSYIATTNTPTNYTITWNAAALTAGLVNVNSTALPATPITFNIAAGVAAGTYTGTVIVTNANSCSNAGNTFTVTINPLPTITTAATAASRCFSSSAQTSTLSYSATTNTPTNYTITWNAAALAAGLVNVSSTALPATPITFNIAAGVAAGTYTGTVRVTNANSCSNAGNTFTVTINPLPTNISPTAVAASVCSGSSTNIQIAASQAGVNYQLRNNATNTAVGGPVAGTGGIINLSTGALTSTTTFNVLASITSTGCNVQMSGTATVVVNPSGQWIGGALGNWNVAGNWCGGIPTSSTNVTIPAGSTVNIQSANALANSISVAAGGSLVMTGAHHLSISAGGTFTNAGTFTASASTGTVAFLGSGTISGNTTFQNIDTYGALDFGTSSTVSGTFSLQTGGSVTGNSPTYTCPSSALLYKPGAVFTRGLEWTTASSAAGYPANVIVQNNTTINFPGAGNGFICFDLQVDAGSSLQQDYSSGSASLSVGRNVTINGTLKLGAASGGDISLGGNWTRNTGGIFTHNDRKVTFDGTGNFSGNGLTMSTISAPVSSAKNNEGGFGGENFAHLWLNKTAATDSVVLLSNITVNRELGLTRGTFSLRNSDVTIVSNDTRTADIAPVTTAANVNIVYGGTGRFVIQRFIHNPTNTRSWRLLAAPFQATSAPTINAAWQEGVVNPDKTNPDGSGGIYNPWPGFGTHITGPGGVYSAANGWDQGTNTASILYANTGVTAWAAPSTTTGTKVTDQQGWMLFVRGDRSFTIGNQYIPSQNTLLEPKGKINTGNVTVPVSAGKQVIANPYPSAISLLNVNVGATNGGNSTYYQWDPRFYTSYTQPGKWVTFTGVGSSFVQTASQSAYASSGIIESGQGFVIDAVSAGNIIFHESDKLALTSSLTGITSGIAARPMTAPNFGMFRTDIYVSNNGTYMLTDGVLNIFDASFRNAADDDAAKLITFNTKESLSILRDSVKIAIEKRGDIQQTDTIFFSMSKLNELPYRFRFEATDFYPGYQAFLEDSYLGNATEISTGGVSEVDFTINSDPLSKVENRFRIVFKRSFGTVLPVTFTAVNAYRKNKDINVDWKVENESNISRYEVERSADGLHFIKKQTETNVLNNNSSNTYQWTDEHPQYGINYFRVKSVDINGREKYTGIAKVFFETNAAAITVFPNPVKAGKIDLYFTEQQGGDYAVTLYTAAGQLVTATKIRQPEGNGSAVIGFDNYLAHGNYILEIVKPDKSKASIKIIY